MNMTPQASISKRYKQILGALQHHLPENGLKSMRILDIGEYHEELPLYLQAQDATVTVLDLDFRETVERCYKDHGIQFHACNLNELPAKPIPTKGPYDIVIWLEVIEHLKCSPKYVFAELERLLKPNGILIMGTPNAARLSSRLRLLGGRHPYLFSIKPSYYGAENFVGHRREYLIGEIDQILAWEGFSPLERIFFNGTREDHGKQPLCLVLPYLCITWLFPRLRWHYIVIARKTGARQEQDVQQKRA